MIDIKELENKIINADCMDILKQLPDKCIDTIICDLPYGTTACSWDSIIPFNKLWEQYKRIRKDNTPIVLFGSEPFSTYLRMSNMKEYRYDLIWKKERPTNPLSAKKNPLKYTENISVFYNKFPIYNPQIIKRKENNKRNNKPRIYTDSTKNIKNAEKYCDWVTSGNNDYIYQGNVLEFNTERGLHPTQKPVKLIEYLIKTYSNEGDLILDNCSGSGTTAVACHNLKRRFICIEKDKEYYQMSVKRYNNEKAQLKLF